MTTDRARGAEPRSDACWIPEFRARYVGWWPEAGPLIERHDYAAAFKSYPWATFAEAPWTPVRKPPAVSRVGVVSTGGLYRPGLDAPFVAEAPDGDPTYRVIPESVAIQRLGIAHQHFPHETAAADMNTIFPLDRLRELEADGVIGEVAPRHWSVMGYCPRAADLAEDAAPAIAAGLAADGVDLALVIPV
jgi:D-proline reductase (dithiol) PrdB